MSYDVIVVGLGAMGTAAAYHLAARGHAVLGLEAFEPGHTRGSSHGESRVIRMAYFEHPDYVPLLRRAYALWDELAEASGQAVIRRTGGLFMGPADGELVAGSLRSARQHNLAHDLLSADEARRAYPAFERLPDEQVALYEPTAGILFPERCLAAGAELATRHGATLRYQEPVVRWTSDGGGVQVDTASASYRGDRLVITAGAWAGTLLADLGLPLTPERIPVFWLQPPQHPEYFALGRLPVWLWETPLGFFYGFPHLDVPGVKLAAHHSGVACDPDIVNREAAAADEEPVRAFARRFLPALDGPVLRRLVCLYTNTPDEHFLVDVHPRYPQVTYAAGFSGHGFKFATVIGELLADLAVTGRTRSEAAFLRADRLRRLASTSTTAAAPSATVALPERLPDA